MKKLSLLTLFLWFCFNPSAAWAQIAGTVTGNITVAENRSLAFIAAVTGTPISASRTVRRVVVAVTAINVDSNFINPTFFAVTDHFGNFTSPWEDQTRDVFPARLRITVLWEGSRSGAGGATTHPATLFRIARVGLGVEISPQSVFFRNVDAANFNLGVLTATANDETAAYLTTEGFFFNIVRKSQTLRSRMPGLVVKTRVPDFNFLFGVAPLPHEVLVSENVPVSTPLVLAHELGHAITWAALDLGSAPINPATDYVHPAGGLLPQWDRDSRETSKAAFLEGLADAWALEWAFGSDAQAVFSRGGKTFRVERGRVISPGGAVVLDCKLVNNAHEFPFCHTVALRDLLDSGGANSDGVDLTRADIVDTLNRFPNCLGNGCRDELGLDALNHNDFLCNATPVSRRIAIRGVWSGNGISGGESSSCGQ